MVEKIRAATLAVANEQTNKIVEKSRIQHKQSLCSFCMYNKNATSLCYTRLPFSRWLPDADEMQVSDWTDSVEERNESSSGHMIAQLPLFYCAHTAVQGHPNVSNP